CSSSACHSTRPRGRPFWRSSSPPSPAPGSTGSTAASTSVMPRWSGPPVSCSPSWALPWLWPCPPSGFPRCSAPSWCWSASAWSSSLTASGGEQECEVRLVTYSTSEGARVGMVDDDRVVDLTAAGFGDMVELIAAGRDASSGLSVGSLPSLPLGEVQLRAPLRPRKNVFAIGRNYAEHLGEVS